MASYTDVTNVLDFQKSFNPAGAFPLDSRSMFGSKAAADAAAATAVEAGSADQANSKYYIGQILTVFEDDVVTHYTIEPNKTLKEVGKSIATDNRSIVISGEVLSLKDFGVQYYAYVPATEDTEATYELTQGWKAGLQPRVVANTDGTGYSLAWYEPSSTTVEGLNEIVGSMQTTVDEMDQRMQTSEEAINKNTQVIEILNADVETEGSVKNQVATSKTEVLTEVDEKYVAQSDIANTSNISSTIEAASEEKVISEKLFIEAMTWKTTM